MQITSLTGSIALNLTKSHDRLLSDVSHLSSGLRIQSAADDPSGLAIAEKLHSQVSGYDQAIDNVQTATNAISVTDGALQTVNDLLDRLLTLSVKANDDLLSATDRNNIQTESQQLQNEINSIADGANFNGVQLLNRQPFSGFPGPHIANSTFGTTPNVVGFTNTPSGTAWTFAGGNAFGTQGVIQTSAAQGADNLQPPPSGSTQLGAINGNGGGFSQTVADFQANSTYALTFNLAQGTGSNPPENVVVQIDGVSIAGYSPISTNPLNPDWHTVTTPAFAPGAGTHVIGLRSYVISGRNLYIDDVQLVRVSGPDQSLPQLGSASLGVHDGPQEGNIVNVTLPTVFTSNLGISADTVATSTAAATFETHLNSAVDAVNGARATLGAQMVALQMQASNANTAEVNFTAVESSIRDADIAKTATAFASDQIHSAITTAILASAASQASLVEKLFT